MQQHNSNSSSVLITGGAGFIGKSVVREFSARGWKVSIYDDFSVGTLADGEPYRSAVDVIRGDILDTKSVELALRNAEATTVVHLAARHYIPYCNAYPVETMICNVVGTHSVIKAALQARCSQFIFASTGALYRSTPEPLVEEREKPSPVDVYGLSKAFCEELCEFYATRTEIRFRIARIFNVYGPGETNPHVIPEILSMLRDGNEQLRLGNVEAKRDYIYVSDVATALVTLAGNASQEKCDVVNVGTGNEYSVAEIVNTIGSLLAIKLTISIDPQKIRAVDKASQKADITKIRTKYGWEPKVTLRNGLRRLLAESGFSCTENFKSD